MAWRFRTAAVSAALLAVSSLGAAAPRTAQPGRSAALRPTLGASRALPGRFYGVNYDYAAAAEYASKGVIPKAVDTALKDLGPSVIRYPGGTGANYFLWQDGYYPTDIGKSHGLSFTLADLAAAWKASGAVPVIDLNVMTNQKACPISCQLAALEAAHKKYGLPVTKIELGNELYLPNANYEKAFPTAASYGRKVATDVLAVHKVFPKAVIAAVGTLLTGPREKGWNAAVLRAASKAEPGVLTMHQYLPFTAALTKDSQLPGLFEEVYGGEQHIINVINKLSRPLPVWVTEYNLRPKYPSSDKTPAQLAFAHALVVAGEDVLWPRVSRVTQVDYWTSLSPQAGKSGSGKPSTGGDYTGPTPTLTPAGLIGTWVDHAAAGATSARPVLFPHSAPKLGKSTDPALLGVQYRGGGSHRDILVNLSAHAETVTTGSAVPRGAVYQSASANPLAEIVFASGLHVTAKKKTGRTLVLPAYSVTYVG